MRMRVLVHRPPVVEKIGGVFQETPWDVRMAWEAHRPYLGRRILNGEATGYCVTLQTLKRAVRRSGRVCGYFCLDGYLVGYGGPLYDPVWTVIPDTCPTLNV